MKAQAAQACDAFECAADFRFLACAIHGRDAVAHARGRAVGAWSENDRRRLGAARAAGMSGVGRGGAMVGGAGVFMGVIVGHAGIANPGAGIESTRAWYGLRA